MPARVMYAAGSSTGGCSGSRPPERAEDDAGFRQIPAAAGRTALREVTERILLRGGYRVLAAANGAEALDLAGT